MAQDDRLAFIGGGNMATAIIGGCLDSGASAADVLAIDPDAVQRDHLRQRFGIETAADLQGDLSAYNTIIWAVKPQVLKSVALQGRAALNPQALHISVAAGVSSDSLADWLQTDRIVRAMPNTPALIGQGAAGVYARSGVDDDDRQRTLRVLGSTGLMLWVENEDLLDAVTAVSGSGPAYFFYLIEAMTEAGTGLGLPRAMAQQLAIATCKGAGELASQSPDAPTVLRQRVTSPGGTTQAALEVMRARDFAGLIDQAMTACAARAKELGRSLA